MTIMADDQLGQAQPKEWRSHPRCDYEGIARRPREILNDEHLPGCIYIPTTAALKRLANALLELLGSLFTKNHNPERNWTPIFLFMLVFSLKRTVVGHITQTRSRKAEYAKSVNHPLAMHLPQTTHSLQE